MFLPQAYDIIVKRIHAGKDDWDRNMNEHEITLAKMTNAELGEKETNRILLQVAEMKRTAELISFFKEEYLMLCDDAGAFIKKHELSLCAYDIEFAFSPKYSTEREKAVNSDNYLEEVPESFFRFRQFFANKIVMKNRLREVLCNPADDKVSKWRLRQMKRCNGAIGGANLSLIHSLFCFEIACGCSVGCDFCGLGAKKLTSLFRYNDENAKLFKEVMTVVKNRFGTAGAMGMLYYATEALDNPDYEKFEKDYYEIFGIIPQITTAVATRNIERTKKLVEELNHKPGLLHRFSVLNQEMAVEIFESFSPSELLKVELIPQYEEAPGFAGFVKSGHADDADSNMNPGTISAIDGFCVNFCEKSVYLFTPVKSDNDNPNGIHIFEKVFFGDGSDFEQKLQYLIDTYMINEISNDQKLSLYDYFKIVETDGKSFLISENGGEKLKISDFSYETAEFVVELLNSKRYTYHEIVDKLHNDMGVMPEVTINLLNQLWNMGYIAESFLQ